MFKMTILNFTILFESIWRLNSKSVKINRKRKTKIDDVIGDVIVFNVPAAISAEIFALDSERFRAPIGAL